MYQAKKTTLQADMWHHYCILDGTAPLSYEAVLYLWHEDSTFRRYFVELLKSADFTAYRWETPPLTTHNSKRQFEFVLHNTPRLAPVAEPSVFAAQFATADTGVRAIAFPNLGHNAMLVVPTPEIEPECYRHLATFCRHAPIVQQERLWQMVGAQMLARLGDRPVWLSTAGGGVSWLHIRLDDRPKYYGYQPYRLSSTDSEHS